ncbi:MAG: type II toxin-antitoxin system VapC family toxin [Candidatus Brocadiia bacterium]
MNERPSGHPRRSQGKITFDEPFESFLPEQLNLNGFGFFNITWQHIAQVHSLPFHHSDPFDRLIISQSLVDELPVITRDRDFPAYGVETIW